MYTNSLIVVKNNLDDTILFFSTIEAIIPVIVSRKTIPMTRIMRFRIGVKKDPTINKADPIDNWKTWSILAAMKFNIKGFIL